MKRSPFCDAHPNGTHLACLDCAEARAAARPAPVDVARRRTGVRPTPEELIAFDAEWPDRSARRRVDGRLLSQDEAVWAKWQLTYKAYSVRLVQALRYRLARCVAADPTHTRRSVNWLERRSTARAERRLS